MISRPLVKFVLTAALRDRLVVTFLAMIVIATALSAFLGAASVTEGGSFALVFGSAALRFLGVLGIVLFCCFYVRRAFETKEVEFLLSRPISRINFLLSHAAAFFVFAFVVAAVVAGAVFFLGKPVLSGLVVWAGGLAVEYIIMAACALFFSLTLSSASGSALAVFGFYVLARLIGTLLGIARLPADNGFFLILNNVMEFVSVIVPRIDLMGQTSWLVYGVDGAGGIEIADHAGSYMQNMIALLTVPGFIVTQGAVFIVLVIAASAFDFSRRQF